MEPERTTVDLGWGSVSYLDWTPPDALEGPDADPVVLLHGGGLDNAWLSWGRLGETLAAAGHRVIAPDHPGFGHTPLPPWRVTQERMIAYVGEFLDALGLTRVTLGGLSMGGGMTLGFTLAHPGRVGAATLFGSYGLTDRVVDGPLSLPLQVVSWASHRTGLLALANRAYANNRPLMSSSLRSIVRSPGRLTPELVDAVMTEAGRPGAFEAFGQWQGDQVLVGRLRTSYMDRLGEIKQPVLVVHGTHDSGVPVARAREAAQLLPRASTCIVEGAGHWVQRDRPDIVEPAVLEFLAGLR